MKILVNSDVKGLTRYCGLKNYSDIFIHSFFEDLIKVYIKNIVFFYTIIYFYKHTNNFYWNNEYNKNIENILFS